MRKHDEDSAEGAMWRQFGLRKALANMEPDSPGRAVIENLLARGTTASTPDVGDDFVNRLERLSSLRERGYLSDQEFEAAKRKLLE
jgi:hypothetical protein